MAHASPSQSALEQALKTYTELLTAKEQTRIKAPTSLADLIDQAAQIQDTLTKKNASKGSRFMHGLDDIIRHLKPFEELLRSACDAAPSGSLIWASISFVFDMVQDNVKAFDEVLDFFSSMAQEMEYLQVVGLTFGNKPLVAPVIEALFAAIMNFWVKAVKHYRLRPSQRRTFFSSFLPSSSLSRKFELLTNEIAEQRTRLQRVTEAQHHHDSAQHQSEVDRRHQNAKEILLLNWINAPTYQVDYHAADKKHHDGTCEWMQTKPEYRRWAEKKEGTDYRFMVIYGIPGAGKTILSSWLINQARLHRSPDPESLSFVLYHYFKAGDDSKRTSMSAVRSLIEQMYDVLRDKRGQRGEITDALENLIENRAKKSRVVFEDLWSLLASFLTTLLHKYRTSIRNNVTIVLDALDECHDPKPLLRELQKLVRLVPFLHVVSTSRRSSDIRAAVSQASFYIITPKDVQSDIAAFTIYKICKIERLRGPEHERLRNNIIAELGKVENHQGMFLWTYLMCKDVKRQLRISAIWSLLRNLPKGLDALYDRILHGLYDGDEVKREFSKLVLQWIVASSRPLRFAELEEAIRNSKSGRDIGEYFDDEEYYDKSYGKGLIFSRKDIVDSCGDLVTYSGLNDGDMIGLIHLSARHFLGRASISPGTALSTSAHADAILFFIVHIPQAECVMSQTCIEYLLAEELRQYQYFSAGNLTETTNRGKYRAQICKTYPLFEYAVLYWPEYAFNALKAKDRIDAEVLLQRVGEFGSNNFASTVWFEDYIRQSGSEFTFYTAQRFLDIPELPSEVIRWASALLHTLGTYGQTVSRQPHFVRLCTTLSETRSIALNKSSKERRQRILTLDGTVRRRPQPPTMQGNSIPPLEKNQRSWIHYDHIHDRIFSTDLQSELIRLMCQKMSSGIRMRAAVDMEEQSPNNTWIVRSAAVGDRGGFVAITFCPTMLGDVSTESLYRTVCWSILDTGDLGSLNEWAQIAFVDRVERSICSVFLDPIPNYFYSEGRGSVVAFGRDNSLICPGGIWNCLTAQRMDGPDSIWRPDPALNVRNTCFSGRGDRVARINNRWELEVLDIDGASISKKTLIDPNFASEDGALILCFSASGGKLVLVYKEYAEDEGTRARSDRMSYELQLHRVCFVLGSSKAVELPVPWDRSARLQFPQFSDDEEKVVGRVNSIQATAGIANLQGSSIVVWTLERDSEDNYPDAAQMLYLFKDFSIMGHGSRLTFCLTPAYAGQKVSTILARYDGSLVRRDLTVPWSKEEEESLIQAPGHTLSTVGGRNEPCFLHGGRTFAMITCSDVLGDSPVVVLPIWSLSSDEPRLLCQPSLLLKAKSTPEEQLWTFTNKGYLTALGQLFHISLDGRKWVALELPFPLDSIIDIMLSPDETRFACVHNDSGSCLLSIFHLKSPDDFSLLARGTLCEDPNLEPKGMSLTFHEACPDLVIYSYWNYEFYDMGTWIAKIDQDGGSLEKTKMSDEYMNQARFSACGQYIYSVDSNTKRDEIQWPTLMPLPGHLFSLSTEAALTRTRDSSEAKRPTVLRMNKDAFVYYQDIFRLRGDETTGVVYLDHKRTYHENGTQGESVRCRVIGIRPDTLLDTSVVNTFLIWPAKSNGEVTSGLEGEETWETTEVRLVVLSSGERVVVYTGLRSEDVLIDEHWCDLSEL